MVAVIQHRESEVGFEYLVYHSDESTTWIPYQDLVHHAPLFMAVQV